MWWILYATGSARAIDREVHQLKQSQRENMSRLQNLFFSFVVLASSTTTFRAHADEKHASFRTFFVTRSRVLRIDF